MKCPSCGEEVQLEDHSIIGGDKEYWSCPNCSEEMVVFVKTPIESIKVVDSSGKGGMFEYAVKIGGCLNEKRKS